MHAHEHPRAREERAEDREGEGRDREREVPDAEESAPILDDDRMDIGGRREPRQQRGVLDGIPPPKAAPAEDLVAPPRAEHDAERERTPGEHRPAALLERPAFLDSAGDEHRDREGEGNAHPNEAEVEQGRVHRDEWIVLQQRVGSGALLNRGGAMDEGVGRTHHQEREEGADREQHDGRPADDRIVALAPVVEDDGERERALEEHPEHQ